MTEICKNDSLGLNGKKQITEKVLGVAHWLPCN